MVVNSSGRPEVDEPSPALVAALCDPARDGELRLAFGHGLTGMADHKDLPPLVAAVNVTVDAGRDLLKNLPQRAQAVALTSNQDDKVLGFLTLEEDVTRRQAQLSDQMRNQALALRTTVDKLKRLMDHSGDELTGAKAAEIRDFFFGLDDANRTKFLAHAEKRGDWRALRAVATSQLLPYRAPKIDPDDLITVAGALRSPRAARVAVAYETLAERLEVNAATLGRQVETCLRGAGATVDQERLNLLRRDRRRA